jgi:uncharacterized protein YdeI (BOF family)
MSTADDNIPHDRPETRTDSSHPAPPARKRRARNAAALGITALAVLAIGGAAGAVAVKLTRPNVEVAPMTPVAISSVKDWTLVTVKGKVSEIFGNKFIVQDQSGRALVETGPSGEDGKLVAANEAVTVQGRFEHGFLHASYIVRENGSVEALGPAGGPHHGPLGDILRRLKP